MPRGGKRPGSGQPRKPQNVQNFEALIKNADIDLFFQEIADATKSSLAFIKIALADPDVPIQHKTKLIAMVLPRGAPIKMFEEKLIAKAQGAEIHVPQITGIPSLNINKIG